MIQWIEPVTNRTQADVNRVKELAVKSWDAMTSQEKTEWSNGLKGALNKADLERIETNIHLLSEVLELGLTTHENDIPVIPNITYWNNLLTNVQSIRESYSIHFDTPLTPARPINEFSKVNDIEKILLDVYTIIESNFFYESIDDYYMGEEVGLVL